MPLLKGIYEKGYEVPSLVQEEVISVVLDKKDIKIKIKKMILYY